MANMHPFMDPKQDRATKTGTATEKSPISFSAKVWWMDREGRDEKIGWKWERWTNFV